MGLAYCDGSEVALSAGLDDRFARTPLRPDALIPSGSVTKPWTTVAMLQMVDQGRVELTTPAYTVVDPGLQKLGPVPGKQLTMSALWGHNPQMSRITIADLMGHSSGEGTGTCQLRPVDARASQRRVRRYHRNV